MTTYTWKNAVAGDWTDAANWQGGSVPNSADADVFIDALPASSSQNYNVTIPTGTSITVNSLDLGNYQTGLVVDGTLTYAPGSSGALGREFNPGALTVNGGTINNAGLIYSFVQTTGNVLFTGSNPIYLAFELQAIDGTAAVDTANIAQYNASGHTLFDGIFDALGETSTVELGGSRYGFTVDVETLIGPKPTVTHSYWTQLEFDNPGSQILEWNGAAYVPIESTLKQIANSAFVTVTNGRDYTTSNTFTIGKDGVFEQAGGSLTTGGLTLLSGGLLVGGYSETGANPSTGQVTVHGTVNNNGQIVATGPGLVFRDAVTGTGEMRFDRTTAWPGIGGDPKPGPGTLEVGSVGAGQTVSMDGGDTLILDQPSQFAAMIQASGANNKVVIGSTTALSLSLTSGIAQVHVDAQSKLTVDAGAGADTIFAGGVGTTVTEGAGSLYLIGGSGTLSARAGIGTVTVFGGTGGGALDGGSGGHNVLVAGGGNTTLTGGGAGDLLVAGSGNTTLVLKGDSTAFGGAGQSTMFGAANDVMVGSGNSDLMIAGAGPEALWAGTGTSVLYGGVGADTLVGGTAGQSTITGGSGGDLIVGSAGKVVAHGGTGDDVFFAGTGDMTIAEGNGSDNVVFGRGNATVTGGAGRDLFTFLNGSAGGSDVISGFKVGTDQIQLFGYGADPARTAANGGSTVVTLSDGTTITLVGVTQLAANSIA